MATKQSEDFEAVLSDARRLTERALERERR
jgi:hypothetical protein